MPRRTGSPGTTGAAVSPPQSGEELQVPHLVDAWQTIEDLEVQIESGELDDVPPGR